MKHLQSKNVHCVKLQPSKGAAFKYFASLPDRLVFSNPEMLKDVYIQTHIRAEMCLCDGCLQLLLSFYVIVFILWEDTELNSKWGFQFTCWHFAYLSVCQWIPFL